MIFGELQCGSAVEMRNEGGVWVPDFPEPEPVWPPGEEGSTFAPDYTWSRLIRHNSADVERPFDFGTIF